MLCLPIMNSLRAVDAEEETELRLKDVRGVPGGYASMVIIKELSMAVESMSRSESGYVIGTVHRTYRLPRCLFLMATKPRHRLTTHLCSTSHTLNPHATRPSLAQPHSSKNLTGEPFSGSTLGHLMMNPSRLASENQTKTCQSSARARGRQGGVASTTTRSARVIEKARESVNSLCIF